VAILIWICGRTSIRLSPRSRPFFLLCSVPVCFAAGVCVLFFVFVVVVVGVGEISVFLFCIVVGFLEQ
jgi:hypothetical protein